MSEEAGLQWVRVQLKDGVLNVQSNAGASAILLLEAGAHAMQHNMMTGGAMPATGPVAASSRVPGLEVRAVA